MTIYQNQFQFSTSLMSMYVSLQRVEISKHHAANIIFGINSNATDFNVSVENQNSIA